MKLLTITFMLLGRYVAATTLDTVTGQSTAENSVEGSSVSGGKASTIRPFLKLIKKPSINVGNLRSTDKVEEFAFQEEAIQHLEQGDRNLQQQAATVTLVNNCGYDAHLAIYYTSGNWIYGRGFYYVRGDGDSFTLAHQVTDQKLHIYGVHAHNGGSIWDAPSSEYCFAQNDCFSPINIGSLASGAVTYKLCGANENPSPPPPIPAPDSSPQQPGLSARNTQWLNEHNSRRSQYYDDNKLSDLPLKWSTTVADSAKAYGDKLLGSSAACNIEHGYQGDDYGGENLGANWGSSVARTPSQVMTAWVDAEIDLPGFFEKLHATQVLFRSSLYVGCADSEKTMSNGSKCFIQTCRYIGAGNCFPSGQTDWKIDVLSETAASRCAGPQCPTEGCF